MYILVVEDQPEFVLMLRSLLRRHEVIAFPRMRDALAVCKEKKFDLVLVDLILEDTQLEATLEGVKQIKDLGNLNVVILTGHTVYDDLCIRHGLRVLHKNAEFPDNLMSIIR